MKFLVLLCFGAAGAISAFAAPATCVTGTYASYFSLGGTGCQDGDTTFSNFTLPGFTNSGGVSQIPDTDILVIPGGTTLDPTLTFEYVNASGTPTPETVTVAGEIFSMGITYQLTLTGATLTSINMGETFSNTAPGGVSATKNAQITGGSMYTSTVNDGGVSNPAGTTLSGTPVATSGTGTWNITDTVSLQAQTGSATQNSFENLFVLAASSTSVPEPSTMLACGVIMLLMGVALKRRRKSGES